MNPDRRALLTAALSWPAAQARAATVHTVAPGQSLAAALASADDGDEIRLLAGEHIAQVGVIHQRRLRLRGVASTGGRTVLNAGGAHAEGKAILVVRDGDVQIDDIEFRGCRVPDGNGAGIRFERGRLTLRGCAFFDNQMGLLTGNVSGSELTVRGCSFGQAPLAPALAHLLYVGSIARLTVSGSRFGGGRRGHLLKSRARSNVVRDNRLVDGPSDSASYELEFPNGGVAEVVNNVIGQSEHTENRTLLAFGAEGSDGRPHALTLAHNTFINFGQRNAVFVQVFEDRLRAAVERRWINNLCVGPGQTDALLTDASQGNFAVPLAALQDAQAGR